MRDTMPSFRKNIKVSAEVHSQLKDAKQNNETWDDFLLRLINDEAQLSGNFEKASLDFGDILDKTGGTSVKLWVGIEIGGDGWSIDTKRVGETEYHVRQRKGRAQIAEELAKGNKIPLMISGGGSVEKFLTRPELTWRVDGDGNPIIADVELSEVERTEMDW